MILAAAENGENPLAPPPLELRQAWQALGFYALPEPGGLLDQPAGLIVRLTVAYNTWFAFKAYSCRDLSKHGEWVEANPDLYATVERVRKLRESHA